ncbi:MAG TPA: hypothetical protein VNJ04_14710 [Gemmatimonadaceae bacterium]|nr:hypothetical protein [Gemmatimonadaceae bacterium]
MTFKKRIGVCATLVACALLAAEVPAQKAPKADKPDKSNKTPQALPTFFDSEDPLAVTLTANIGRLRRDKSPNPPWRAAALSYTSADAATVTVPLKVRTRGIWRLKTCEFPPLRLNFSGGQAKGTVFQRLDKPKLVSFCRDRDNYEQYVLQELQLYRAYQVLTPVSHKVRLLRVAYTDSANQKTEATRYAIMLEEPDALAARLGWKIMDQKGAMPGDLDPFFDSLVGVFQYFIGNTDFSTNGLHNMELLQKPDGTMIPLAYDFDFSGAVNAAYATVDPKLSVTHVRARLFRGYCTEGDSFAKVFALFNEKKDQIYALYGDPVGRLLDPRVAKETLQYFDAFYRTINDSRSARREILEACIGRP